MLSVTDPGFYQLLCLWSGFILRLSVEDRPQWFGGVVRALVQLLQYCQQRPQKQHFFLSLRAWLGSHTHPKAINVARDMECFNRL